jgi:hypothetical protein
LEKLLERWKFGPEIYIWMMASAQASAKKAPWLCTIKEEGTKFQGSQEGRKSNNGDRNRWQRHTGHEIRGKPRQNFYGRMTGENSEWRRYSTIQWHTTCSLLDLLTYISVKSTLHTYMLLVGFEMGASLCCSVWS